MFDYTDEDGIFWEGDEDAPGIYVWLWGKVLNFCGCYSSNMFNDVINAFLSFDNEKRYCWYTNLNIEGPDKYKELIMQILTEKDLIEHGSSCRGSWLTGKGSEVMKKIKEAPKSESHLNRAGNPSAYRIANKVSGPMVD